MKVCGGTLGKENRKAKDPEAGHCAGTREANVGRAQRASRIGGDGVGLCFTDQYQ